MATTTNVSGTSAQVTLPSQTQRVELLPGESPAAAAARLNVSVKELASTDSLVINVAQGENLTLIARRLGCSLNELLAANRHQFDARLANGRRDANGRDPDLIHAGKTKIVIPESVKVRWAAEARDPEPVLAAAPADSVQAAPVIPSAPKVPVTDPVQALQPQEPALPTKRPPSSEASQPDGGVKPEAAGDAKAAEKPGFFGSAFAALRKVFSNRFFQGALAVLCALPGIGQVVSGLAAATSLLMFVGGWSSTGKPDWLTLGGGLLYLGGAFMPGFGAFGGMFGMIFPPGESIGRAGAGTAKTPARPSAQSPKEKVPEDPLPTFAATVPAAPAAKDDDASRPTKRPPFAADVETPEPGRGTQP